MKVRLQTTFKAVAILALSALLCIAGAFLVPKTPFLAAADGVTFTAVDGFNAGGDKAGEGYANVLDGKKTQYNFTKWCAEIADQPYIVIKASETVVLTGYTFTVGNDNADATKGAGRNPKDWTLEGSNDFNESTKTGTWTNIVTVTNDTTMEDINFKDYSFTVSGNQTPYQYYKFKITAVRGENATLMQLTEIALSYTMPPEPAPVITPLDGTNGHSGEGYTNLFDGKYTQSDFSKWCLQGGSAFLVFKVETTKYLAGYSFVTGNDNQSNGGRNPKTWVLYGANDYDEAAKTGGTWTVVHSVTNDTVMQDLNYTRYDYDVHTPVDYTYYKLEIAANHGSDVTQLAELILTFSDCLHNWQVSGVNGRTCTSVSETKYVCSKCSEEKTVYGTDYAYHDVDGDFKCKNCGVTFVKTVGGFTVSGAQENRDYTFSDNELKILTGAKITIENADKTTSTDNRVYVQSGVSADIVLAGVNIVSGGTAFKIADNSTGDVVITLKDGSVNTLQSGNNCAGLQKNGLQGSLTINGNTGKLIATGGSRGAGIGTSSNERGPKFANLTINGGIIIATGGMSAAGIGCGAGYDLGSNEYTYAEANNITINGGLIVAKGSDFSAGIGAGHSRPGASVENVVISGGSVKATHGRQAKYDIGQGTKLDGITQLVPEKALQIVNGDGGNVYFLTISNPNGEDVYVDGVKQKYANHSVADATDTNLYLYLTCEDHVIKIGDEETTYHCNEGSFIVCAASSNFQTNDEAHWYACNYSDCIVQYGYTAHVYDKEVQEGHVKTAASCTVQGEYYKSCVCGKDGTETFFGPEPAHNWIEKRNTDYKKEDKNCEHGVIYYKACSKCGAASTETWTDGEGTGHDFTSTSMAYEKKAATCTEPAEYWRQCTKCLKPSDTLSFTYGNPKGHDWQLVIAEKYLAAERSCTSRTTYYFSCKTCEISAKGITQENGGPYRETFEDTDEPTPSHNYVWKEDDAKENHYKECTVCGDIPDSSKGVHWYIPSCGVECHDCGLLREDKDENHNFYVYSEQHDDTYHWYICHNVECNKVIRKAEHTFNEKKYVVRNSGQHELQCDTCYYRKPVENCTYEMTWNDTYHTQVCKVCGHDGSIGRHVYDNACDTTCNNADCQYVRTVEHDYDTAISKNETQHWYECKICGDKTSVANHVFTPKRDKDEHWQECDCGQKKDVMPHVFDDDNDTTCNGCTYVRPIKLKSIAITSTGYVLDGKLGDYALNLASDSIGIDFSKLKKHDDYFIITDLDAFLESDSEGTYKVNPLSYKFDVGDHGYFMPDKNYWVVLQFSMLQGYDYSSLTNGKVTLDGKIASYFYLNTEDDLVSVIFALTVLEGESTIENVGEVEITLENHALGSPVMQTNFATENANVKSFTVNGFFTGSIDNPTLLGDPSAVYDDTTRYSVIITLDAKDGYTFYGAKATDFQMGDRHASQVMVSAGGGKVMIGFQIPSLKTCTSHTASDWIRNGDMHYKECTACYKIIESGLHVFDSDHDVDCNSCGYKRQVKVDSIELELSGYGFGEIISDIKLNLGDDAYGVRFYDINEYGYSYYVTDDYIQSMGSSEAYVPKDDKAYFRKGVKYYLIVAFKLANSAYDVSGLDAENVFIKDVGNALVVSIEDYSELFITLCFELPVIETGESEIEIVKAGKQTLSLQGYEENALITSLAASLSQDSVGSDHSTFDIEVWENGKFVDSEETLDACFTKGKAYEIVVRIKAVEGYDFFGFAASDVEVEGGFKVEGVYVITGGGSVYVKLIAPSLEENHVHDFGTDYLYDDNGHWQKCSGCRDITEPATHVYQEGGSICTVCKYVKLTAIDKVKLTLTGYNYGETVVSATVSEVVAEGGEAKFKFSDGMTLISDKSSLLMLNTSDVIDNPTTVFTDAKKYYLVLGLQLNKKYMNTHTFESLTAEDIEIVGLTKACSISIQDGYFAIVFFELPEIYLEHQHTYGAWTEIKAPTCTAKGTEKHVCTYCKHEETRDINATGHDYSDWSESKAPTCTAKGEETHTCANCGDVEKRDVNALGHDYGDLVNKEDATCTATGVEAHYECGRCHKLFDDKKAETTLTALTIAVKGHSYGDWTESKAPTCTEKGEETHACANCGNEETRELPTIDHSYGAWVRDKEPTANEQGHEYRECANCGHREETAIPALDSVQSCLGGFNSASAIFYSAALILTACGFALIKKGKKQ